MTREEATKELSYIADWIEALNMAINALEQEPCEDCISRKAVLNTLEFCDKVLDVDRTVESYKSLLAECYKMLSSIQPKPKTGQWIEKTVRGSKSLVCSECGSDLGSIWETNYCPNCGARMESEDKE